MLAVLALTCALATPAHGADALTLSLPVSIPADRAEDLSRDLLGVLSARSGERIALAGHANPLGYVHDLKSGRFDVVIEGPHVLAALAEHGDMVPVAEFKFTLSYVVVVPKHDTRTYEIHDLAGKPVCAGEMPDLFALELTANVGNPTREPVMIPVADYLRRMRFLLSGRCLAATLQTTRYLTLDEAEGADELRIIYKSDDLPGFGAAVSSRLEGDRRAAIASALTSAEASWAARGLAVALFGNAAPLAAVDPSRLRPLAGLMDAYFAW